MLPLSPLAKSTLFNLNNLWTSLLTASTLHIKTHPEVMKLLIYNKILTPPRISDLPLLLINDTYLPVLLPEL